MIPPPAFPTPDDFKGIFWAVFDSLPSTVQSTIRNHWSRLETLGIYKPVPKVTINTDFVMPGKCASTDSVQVAFDLPKISHEGHSLVRTIYHELAHCYKMAKGEQWIPEMTEAKRAKYEKETIRVTEVWLTKLTRNPAKLAELAGDIRLQRLTGLFDLFPLKLATPANP